MLDLYPPASLRLDGVSGGNYISVPWRVVLHTTETRTVPGYNNGASAPHLTYFPAARAWVQHTRLNTAARALRNLAGGVETNRARAIQVEIVCYSSKPTSEKVNGIWVGHLSPTQLSDIRQFLLWAGAQGVKMNWPGKQALSHSEAARPGFRMTGSQWLAYNAVCGHQHVMEQGTTLSDTSGHWDPGALNWSALFPSSTTSPQGDEDMFSKNLTAETWGVLYDLGIVKGADRQGTINYWLSPDRTDADHAHATNAIIRDMAKFANVKLVR